MIPLSRPSYMSFADDVCKAVNKVILSGNIAQGIYVKKFENMIAEYTGTKYCIAVSSGTAGLFLCLKACNIGPGDEVITTPFSFIASSNVIVHAGAKPVFVDIDRDTYNINTDKVMEYYNRINRLSDISVIAEQALPSAIIPVDVFGSPVDTNYWLYGADKDSEGNYKYYPKIIIDSCESFGSKMSRPFDTQVFAFYGNKQLTTGEGGIICTNNKDIAEYCYAARNQGRKKGDTWLESSMIGYNFRMTDIQAVIGIEQLKRWDEIFKKRAMVWINYLLKLPPIVADYPKWEENNKVKVFSPFVFTIEVPNRDKVMQYLLSHGIECRAYFPCIHLQKPYRDMGYKEGDFPIAEEVASRTLALPFYTDMTEAEVNEVCRVLNEALVCL